MRHFTSKVTVSSSAFIIIVSDLLGKVNWKEHREQETFTVFGFMEQSEMQYRYKRKNTNYILC